jgi:hypothetical protein
MMQFTDETMWLNITNGLLGLVVLICVMVVGGSVVQELVARYKTRRLLAQDDHMFSDPILGLTMADGGEKIEDKKEIKP